MDQRTKLVARITSIVVPPVGLTWLIYPLGGWEAVAWLWGIIGGVGLLVGLLTLYVYIWSDE